MAVRAQGIETVYQDLALFDNLDPAANFFAGRELVRARVAAPRAAPDCATAAWPSAPASSSTGSRCACPTSTPSVALMSGGQRQAVAVARAVAFSSKLVILDEPTAALGLRESARVLDLIRRLKDDGVAVILISHSMDHVMAVADRALVLRRGRTVGETAPTAENHEQLVSWIVGAVGRPRRLSAPTQIPVETSKGPLATHESQQRTH